MKKTFEIGGWRPKICKYFEITITIFWTVKGQNNFGNKIVFQLVSRGFSGIHNKLEKLEFKLERIIGI